MPSVKSQIAAEEGDDSDDDIEVGGTTQRASSKPGQTDPTELRCPLSGAMMEEPMKNERCPHRIDRLSVEDYFKPRTAIKSCPMPGCNNRLVYADFSPDAKARASAPGHADRTDGTRHSDRQAARARAGGGPTRGRDDRRRRAVRLGVILGSMLQCALWYSL